MACNLKEYELKCGHSIQFFGEMYVLGSSIEILL